MFRRPRARSRPRSGQADGGFAGVVDTGWLCGLRQHRDLAPGNDQKKSDVTCEKQKIFFNGSRSRDRRLRAFVCRTMCVERPESTTEDGALIFRPDQDQA
jgi:hypothetical protein